MVTAMLMLLVLVPRSVVLFLFLKTEGSRFTDVGDRENPFGDTQEARFLQQIKEKTPFSGNTRAEWYVIQHLAFQFITFTADHNCNA